MVETRSGVGAGAQTSFLALAFIVISAGLGLVQDAGGDQEQMYVGLGMIICGVAIIFAKYFIKLPDVSESEMQETIAVLASTYESLIKQAQVMYSDAHRLRDEIVKHRKLIEATAALLPAKYQIYLKEVLDALEHKYGVPD